MIIIESSKDIKAMWDKVTAVGGEGIVIKKIDINHKNKNGENALCYAKNFKYYPIIRLLDCF